MTMPRHSFDPKKSNPARIVAELLHKAMSTEIYVDKSPPPYLKFCEPCETKWKNSSIPIHYFETTAIMMTEGAFYTLIKDINAEQFGLNRMGDKDGFWTFQGYPIAVVKQTVTPKQDWVQIV